jgi:hypothetical protein
MPDIITKRDQQNIKITTDLATTSLGLPATSTDFVDYDGATAIEGLLLPIHDQALFSRNTSTAVTNVSTAADDMYPFYRRYMKKNPHVLTISSHGFSQGDVIVLGTTATQILVTNVLHVIDTDTVIVRVPTNGTFSADLLAAGNASPSTLVAEQPVIRMAGGIALGLASFLLDPITPASGYNVRLALILTDDPTPSSPALTFTQRETAKEVVWSRVYPVGALVNIDFAGLGAADGHLMPVAQNTQKRLMLVTYAEDGTPTSLNVTYEITYDREIVVEKIR